jgi:FAD/FMN-containing dehydrogenase
MHEFLLGLGSVFKGEIINDQKSLDEYSYDASIYEMMPEAILLPKDTTDIKHLVNYVNRNKDLYPSLSITPRGAGTDMSGAAITDSLIIDMTKHFNSIYSVSPTLLHSQSGVFMRDIDPLLLEQGAMLGCVPASRKLITIGGMVANNSAGEQSLRYGNVDKSIREVTAVLADGNEYTFKPINKKALQVKIAQNNFEGKLYKGVFELIENNYDHIKNARPKTNKNSMGYNLWSTWDRETGVFDMTQILTGSQGTLGVITDIKIAAVPKAKYSGLLLAYLTNIKHLDEIIPLVSSHHPATFEGFDDVTFGLGIKHFNMFRKELGLKEWAKQQTALLGSVAKFKGHIPGVVLMIEFEGKTQQEVDEKITDMNKDLKNHRINIRTEIEDNEEKSQPFWEIRRASLSLLRMKAANKYASAFMDDMAVQPRYIPEFFPLVRKIIKKYKLPATISGHFGDGNFHIIPLVDIRSAQEQAKLEPAMRELIPIVLKYGGTMAGEHNDGMVRGPWLAAQFGDEMYELFKDVKEIFDPQYIFNPHKKTDANWEFSMGHIRSDLGHDLYS